MSTIPLIMPNWDAPGNIVAGTTTRSGGVSSNSYASNNFAYHVGESETQVSINRSKLASQHSSVNSWQWLNQIHSSIVINITGSSESLYDADALYTREKALALCVMTADCLPAIFTCKGGDQIAIAHAGWRGLAEGVLENTLAEFSCPVNEIRVWFGPAIAPCHFEVGQDVYEKFALSGISPNVLSQVFRPSTDDKYFADLYGLAQEKLNLLGVDDISGGEYCTVCDTDKFYSYRRDGVTGRMVSFVYINPSS